MNILLTGATGFIGMHLAHALYLAGHSLCCAVRNPEAGKRILPPCRYVKINFAQSRSAIDWLPHLQNIDAVINAVGIFAQTRGDETFAAVHTEAPCALFSACAIAGIKCVVQISALGADLNADTEFLRSKARADHFLLEKNLRAMILQPSLIFGRGGQSSELFVRLAALRVVVLPDGGKQLIQPVHIDDILTAILHYLETSPSFAQRRIAAVGPHAISVRNYVGNLTTALGNLKTIVIGIDSATLARLSKWLPLPWISADALRMLQRGNRADAGDFSALLGREPRAPENFSQTALAIRDELKLRAGFRTLRYCIAVLWILTGIISFGVYPIESSKLLLARVGIPAHWQTALLYGAAALDIAFGIASFFSRKLRWLWWAQIVTIVFYSAVIAWKLPEFWLHPYAPMLKNIPLLAALYLLMQWERAHVRHR